MQVPTTPSLPRLPMQSPLAITTAAAMDTAFAKFLDAPTAVNQEDVLSAIDVHLAVLVPD